MSRSEWPICHASVIFHNDWISIELDKLVNDMLYVWLIDYLGHADLNVMLQWFLLKANIPQLILQLLMNSFIKLFLQN